MKPRSFNPFEFMPMVWGFMVVVGVIGWLLNLMSVANLALAGAPVTTLFLLKVIGIFVPPIGVILGYLS